MKNRLLILILALGTLLNSSCEKYNQIDNSTTVKTPFVLYIGGYQGTLHKMNDLVYFSNIFPTDNATLRQVLVADTMLLFLKENFYYSGDEGRAFVKSNVGQDYPIRHIDAFYKYYLPNSALYNPDSNIVYLCCDSRGDGKKNLTFQTGLDNLVLKYSTDNGKNFVNENRWNDPQIGATSITRLDNGHLFIIKDSANLYKKQPGNSWTKVPQGVTGTPAKPLPTDTTIWYLSHRFNTLFAIDYTGQAGIWYSLDEGLTWDKTVGLPKKEILFANQPFGPGTDFFAGLDSGGLYRLDANSFVSVSAGIPWYAKVSYVEGKRVVYRTDEKRYYLFCATDQGLYISENYGTDWKLFRNGIYSTLK
ncbi:MAG: hypothetical protein JNM44_01395 [Chitinophagaceae bacterium]|nr:hypothetical protein [Chitinophagaceae bacterium]